MQSYDSQLADMRSRMEQLELSFNRRVEVDESSDDDEIAPVRIWRRFLGRSKLLYKIWPPKWFFQTPSFISL